MSSLLPPNSTAFERSLESSIERSSDIDQTIGDLWNPQTCPLNLLPWLAWALSVDQWDPGWSEAKKREAVALSISLHERKGTAAAVKDSVKPFGVPDLEITEWFETGGPAHTFQATSSAPELLSNPSLQSQIVTAITSAKPVRSHFSLIARLNLAASITPVITLRALTFQRLSFKET